MRTKIAVSRSVPFALFLVLLSTSLQAQPSADRLFAAVVKKDAAGVQSLLANGANPGATNPAGVSALLLAAGVGDVAIVKALLSKGAVLSEAGPTGATPLVVATYLGRRAVVQLLLQSGAEKDPAAQAALVYSLFKCHPDITRDLEAAGIERPAAVRRDPQNMQEFLQQFTLFNGLPYTAMRNALEASGLRILDDELVLAAEKGDATAVARLLKEGAPPNSCMWTKTPINQAISSKNMDAVKALLEGGADPRFTGAGNQTPLEAAQKTGNAALVDLLNGALAKK